MGKKFTYEEVKNFIEVESNSGCKLISKEYIHNTNKLEIQCACGNSFLKIYNSFKQGQQRCNECAMKIKIKKLSKTHEQFCQEVKELTNDEYEVLGKYIKNKTKILIKHKICGYEYFVKPNSFTCGCRCPKCAGTMKKNTEEFKEEVYHLTGDEYTVLGEYINNNTKILVKHNICNREYLVTPDSFLQGDRCSSCSHKLNGFKSRKSNVNFCKEIYNLVGDEYTALDEYTTAYNKIRFKHNICGNIFYSKPNVFLGGSRCPACFKNEVLTTEEVKNRIYNLHGEKYSLLGNYINMNTKVLIRHNICGHEWSVRPINFLNGSQCPICAFPYKGEEAIRNILKLLNLNYKEQYSFENCKYNKPLRFDFAIFNNINKTDLFCLIEYQGEQHYNPVRFGGISYDRALDNFKFQKIKDDIKRNYCINNNINYLEIPYWNLDNIEIILNDYLNEIIID